MGERIKQYLIYALVIAVGYFLMSYHIIYFGRSFTLLKKSQLTLNYTFYSLDHKSPEKVMDVDDLRRDGIGQVLLKLGLVDEEKLQELEESYEDQ